MNLRDRAYFATSALVYSGPLYAGLSGYGMNIVPMFAVLFMLWLYVVRPFDWPQTSDAWRNPRALAWPLLVFSVQMVLVTFCIMVGKGIGAVAGIQPPLPLIFSALISMLGISTARIIQPQDANYAFRVPGEHLSIGSGILDVAVPAMPGESNSGAFVEGVLMHLADIGPHRAPRDEIVQVVQAVNNSGMGKPVLMALASSRGETAIHAQAQATLALSPGVARDVAGTGLIGKSITRALSTWVPQIIEDAAQDALALLDVVPGVVGELPSATRLQQAARAVAGGSASASDALHQLAERVAAAGQESIAA